MYLLIFIVFVLGYSAIALEHPLKIDKAASALFTAVAVWVLLIFGKNVIFSDVENPLELIEESLMHNLGEVSGILFFLLGAMTIVELVDKHGGFEVITDKIKTTSKSKLLWILSFLTFFMSAALDNLTTSIIMAALLRKLIADKKDLWIFAGIVIIAANAGGAWSPIGDVTTIMLWIGSQITAANVVFKLIVPSLVCLIVPLALISFKVKGTLSPVEKDDEKEKDIPEWEKKLIMYLGIGSLLFVPVFKTITHLPPFMGILLGLSVLWITTEILHRHKPSQLKRSYSIVGVLEKIDTPSVLFFLGILLAVGALQTAGHLNQLASFLDHKIGNIWLINSFIGVFSSVVDNVPLVAGAIGMYGLDIYPQNHIFWELLAYCAGTGGSILIIGSAAGVAIMGIFKIDFIWYLKNITLYAFLGYIAGILSFLLLNTLF